MVIDDPILVLESNKPDVLGDLSIFRNVLLAEKKLEPIDVENNEYYAWTLTGKRLSLKVDRGKVQISLASNDKGDAPLVRKLLEDHIDYICKCRMLDKPDVTAMSKQQLIEFIGYTR